MVERLLREKVIALGDKIVNQKKHEIVCKHAVPVDKAVKVLYYTKKWYNRSSDLGGYFDGTMWL